MDKAERVLADIRQRVPDMIGDIETQRFINSAGTAFAMQYEAGGMNRSGDVLSLAIEGLEKQNIDIQQVKRLMVVLGSSSYNPSLMREKVAITKGVIRNSDLKDIMIQTPFYNDEALADRLQLTLILWIPEPSKPQLLEVQ